MASNSFQREDHYWNVLYYYLPGRVWLEEVYSKDNDDNVRGTCFWLNESSDSLLRSVSVHAFLLEFAVTRVFQWHFYDTLLFIDHWIGWINESCSRFLFFVFIINRKFINSQGNQDIFNVRICFFRTLVRFKLSIN